MKKKHVGVMILLIVVAVLIVGAFVLVLRNTPNSEDTTEVTELDELLNKNISANYPATPREVMKLYNRYILCLYGSDSGELTASQVEQLGVKMRELYDDELMESNPQSDYLLSLESEIGSFQQAGTFILQANVCDSNEVVYEDIYGDEGALVETSYFMKTTSNSKSTFTRTYQQYLLRKDESGNWKILGFEKVSETSEGDS